MELLFFIEPTPKSKDKEVNRRPGLLLKLYERLQAMQRALRDNPNITLINLLKEIDPRLAGVYRAKLEEKIPEVKRFDTLTQGLVGRADNGTITTTKGQMPGSYSRLVDYQKYGWTIESASADLDRIIQAKATIEDYVRDLIHGKGEMLRALNSPEISDQVVRAIHFSSLPIDQQERILAQITGLSFVHLHLNDCEALDTAKLYKILKSCPDLTLLDLGGCSQVKELPPLDSLCPKLLQVNLRGMQSLTRVLGFKKRREPVVTVAGSIVPLGGYQERWRPATLHLGRLRCLDISHCPSLSEVKIMAPSLEILRCHGPLPKKTSLRFPPLKELHVDDPNTLRRLHPLYKPAEIIYDGYRLLPAQRVSAAALPPLNGIEIREGRLIFYEGKRRDLGGSLQELAFAEPNCTLEAIRGVSPACIHVLPFSLEALLRACLAHPTLETLSLSTCQLTDEHVSHIARACPNLRAVNFIDCRRLTSAGVAALSEGCSQLTHLDLRNCQFVDSQGIEQLAHTHPNLRSLRLDGCIQITDEAVLAIAEHCTRIEELTLGGCQQLTDAALVALAEGCRKLRVLNLEDCNNITDKGFIPICNACVRLEVLNIANLRQLSSRSIDQIANRLMLLRVLNILNAPVAGRRDVIPDSVPPSLLKSLPHLESLTATGGFYGTGIRRGECRTLRFLTLRGHTSAFGHNTITSFEALSACPSLTSVTLTDKPGLDYQALVILSKNCPQLEHLNLKNFGSDLSNAQNALVAFRNLRSLNLSKVEGITNPTLVAIARANPNLEVLNLNCMHRKIGEPRIDQETLHSIAKSCPKLKELHLYAVLEFDPSHWVDIAQHLRHLEVLDLRVGGSALNDKALTALVRANPRLRALGLLMNDHISDAGITAIAEHCSELTELNIGPTTTAIDPLQCVFGEQRFLDSIGEVLNRCPRLRTLVIRNLPFLRREISQLVRLHCRELIELDLRCMHQPAMGLTDYADEEWERDLRQKFPYLKIKT